MEAKRPLTNTKQRTLYQVQLYDYNCSPIVDGTIRFFVDDLETFEKNWTALTTDKKQIDRFIRSKTGEVVTDYYSDDPSLNIVQEKNVEVLNTKVYEETDVITDVMNAYGWPSTYHMDSIIYYILYIRNVEDDELLKICRYKIKGLCRCEPVDLSPNGFKCKDAEVYGNCFVKINNKVGRPSDNTEDFKEVEAELFVWHIIKQFIDMNEINNDLSNYKLGKREKQTLLMDFPGEIG